MWAEQIKESENGDAHQAIDVQFKLGDWIYRRVHCAGKTNVTYRDYRRCYACYRHLRAGQLLGLNARMAPLRVLRINCVRNNDRRMGSNKTAIKSASDIREYLIHIGKGVRKLDLTPFRFRVE